MGDSQNEHSIQSAENPKEWEVLDEPTRLNVDKLIKLKVEGWVTVGIVAAVIDTVGNILSLEHNISAKNVDGAIGPLAETSQMWFSDKQSVEIETCSQTLCRGLAEELNLADPVALTVSRDFPSFTFAWPRGDSGNAFAICPVLRCEEPDHLTRGFKPSKEVRAVSFQSPDSILLATNVRQGTHGWIRKLLSFPAYADGLSVPETRSLLPAPQENASAKDIRLGEIDI